MNEQSTDQPQEPTPHHARGPAPLSRLNLILALVLLVQGALIAIVYWPQPSVAAGGPLLADIALEDIVAFSIEDNNGNSVQLERAESGWVMANTDGFPANPTRITEIVTKLLDITTNRLVTNTESSHRRSEVAQDGFSRRIDLTTDAGTTTLFIGSSAGAGATHVRADGQSATYLTNEIEAWEINPTPSSWIDSQYSRLSADEITELTLTNANGRFEFSRDEDAGWMLVDLDAGEAVNTARIETLVNQLAAVNLTRPLGTAEQAEYGLDEPQATLTATTLGEDGIETSHTFLLGAKTGDESAYYFKWSDSPYYVTISAFTGDEFAQRIRDDFVTEPEATQEPELTDIPGQDDSAGFSLEPQIDESSSEGPVPDSPLALPEESTPPTP